MEKQKDSGKHVLEYASAGFFLLLGLFGLVKYSMELVQGQRSQNWPTTEGVITRSYISTYAEAEGAPSHDVKLFYSYVVEDVTYLGDRISLAGGFTSSSFRAAEKVMLQYQPGTVVTVAYDPHDPKRALLNTGSRSSSGWLLVISGAFAVFGALHFWSTRRTRREKTSV